METTLIKDPLTMLAIIKQVPGNYLILSTDHPKFTIVEVSQEYNRATFTKRNEIIGKGIFEVFPNDPNDPDADGEKNLRASLMKLIESGEIQEMPIQKHPIYQPDTARFEEKFWLPINKPVFIDGDIKYIVHVAEDITENRLLRMSERYFRSLTDEAPFMVWRSIGGGCNYVNKTWSEFTGLSLKESMGAGYLSAFYPDDAAEQVALFKRASNDNLSYESKYRIRRRDGEFRWVYMRASPHFIDDIRVEYIGSLFDITEQEHARQVIEEREAWFRKMLDALPQLTWMHNASGEASFHNQRCYKYTGINSEAGKDVSWEDFVHPDDVEASKCCIQSILDSGNKNEFENRYRRADGTYRWHLNQMQPHKNEKGEIELWVGTATDIHDLKLLQQQKDDFISIASHELRTPITSLKASLQVLKRMKNKPFTEVAANMIDRANLSIEKVSVLVEDLLQAGKLTEGQVHLKKDMFRVVELIEEYCDHFYQEGMSRVVVTGDENLQVYADPESISQVIVNLVNNAMKYAPQSKEIRIHLEKVDDAAKISIIDTGPGIAPEKHAHLFDRYFRVNAGDVQLPGLGLGLYICSEIIKKHDGEIGVESEVGKGSSFWFSIPLNDPSAE